MSGPREFRKGQHIVVERLIPVEGRLPVPIGRYVIAEIRHGMLGGVRCLIRSIPDEDIEAEVSLEDLAASARRLEEEV